MTHKCISPLMISRSNKHTYIEHVIFLSLRMLLRIKIPVQNYISFIMFLHVQRWKQRAKLCLPAGQASLISCLSGAKLACTAWLKNFVAGLNF